MNKILWICGLMMVFLLMNGCSNSAKRTALHDFGLGHGVSQQPFTKPAITVDAPTWLWDNRIRYRLLYAAPTQVRFYGLDLWVASPPELFEQYLLNNTSAITLPLVIRLLGFEQQFETAKQAKIVLRFSVEAYSVDRQTQLGSQLFSLMLSTQTPDAAGAIAGFTILVQQAAGKIQNWMTGLQLKSTILPEQ